jgi:hypothetical protein
MRQNDSAITIIAIALGLCLTSALLFGNFSLAYLVKLFSEGRGPLANMLFVFAVTATNIGVLVFLAQWRLRAIRASTGEVQPVRAKQDTRQRWQEAKEKVLGLAQAHAAFTIQEVMRVTTFNRSESEYLLDELLNSDVLSVYQDADEFKYCVKASTTINH